MAVTCAAYPYASEHILVRRFLARQGGAAFPVPPLISNIPAFSLCRDFDGGRHLIKIRRKCPGFRISRNQTQFSQGRNILVDAFNIAAEGSCQGPNTRRRFPAKVPDQFVALRRHNGTKCAPIDEIKLV